MINAYTRNEVAAMCREYFNSEYGSVVQAALALGVSESYLSQIQTGKKNPPLWLREKLNIARVPLYVRLPHPEGEWLLAEPRQQPVRPDKEAHPPQVTNCL